MLFDCWRQHALRQVEKEGKTVSTTVLPWLGWVGVVFVHGCLSVTVLLLLWLALLTIEVNFKVLEDLYQTLLWLWLCFFFLFVLETIVCICDLMWHCVHHFYIPIIIN
jgi:hypothetical protein